MKILLVAVMIAAAVSVADSRAQSDSSSVPVQAPRDRRAVSATGTAAIRGRVLAGDTGRPLRRARISVSAPELGNDGRNTSTDADGHYEVTDLPAGRYTLLVTRSGYLPLRYGQRRPLEPGMPLQILDKQLVDNVDFVLPRMSLISGRVTDESGDPIEGVNVYALRSAFFRGQRQFVPVARGPQVRTDDAGQYRLLGLAPGSYLVSAMTRETWTVNRDGVKQVMGYAPTYFPGTTHVSEAQAVTVGLGKEVSGIDVSLQIGRAASVSGSALDSRGRPFSSVVVRQEVRGPGFSAFAQVASAPVAADGTFMVDHVPPGEYVLAAATGRDTETREVAELPIAVDGVDITGVTLTGSQGGTISGRILTDTGAVPALPRLRITVVEHTTGQPSPVVLGAFKNPGVSEVQTDGSFKVEGVFGRSRLNVTLPAEWAVVSVQHDGRDVTDQAIELRSGEAWSDVQILITNRVTTLAGQITDMTGQPTTQGTIVVFAADASRWTNDSRYVRSARADQQGQWQIKGLPPADYFAAALDYVEEGIWNDPEYLASIERYAHRLTLSDGDTQSVSLTVVKQDQP